MTALPTENSCILIDETEINDICTRLAKQIDKDYSGSNNLVLIGILKGSVIFMTDLMRKMETNVELDFMRVSSYGDGMVSSGNIDVIYDLQRPNIASEDLLIVEDIVDSGRTLKHLITSLKEKGAKSVKCVTLLDKPSRREVDITPEYVGKQIEDRFVFGYGLDYIDKYRTLPFVGSIKKEN